LILSRAAVAVLLAIVAVAAMGCWPCPECPQCPECPECPKCPPPPVEHQMFIQSAGSQCQIVDADGNASASAKQGEWVVWTNSVGKDVRLDFSSTQRLFGVERAIAYATGEPLKLQLRKDAAEGEFAYKADCGTPYPGPIIIIPPPPGP
jgi:hypothetical protein